MKRFSLRAALMAWYSAILCVVLVAVAVGVYVFLKEEFQEERENRLRQEAQETLQMLDEFRQDGQGKGAASIDDFIAAGLAEELGERFAYLVHPLSVRVLNAQGGVMFERGDMPPSLWRRGENASRIADGEVVLSSSGRFLVAVGRSGPYRVVLSAAEGEMHELLADLRRAFYWITPLAVCVAVLGGYLISLRVLRPVRGVVSMVKEIRSQDLGRRLPERDVPDEISLLTRAFNDLLDNLEQSFDRIKQFSLNASHELRTPLTAMRGQLEVALRSERAVEEYQAILADAVEEIARLSKVIDNLLLLAQADNDALPLERNAVALEELIEDVAEQALVLAAEKGLALRFERAASPWVNGDPHLLKQVFLNLLSNAVKFTPPDGAITVRLEEEPGWARVEVRDTGVGMDPDAVLRVFDRFYRADPQASAGLGLGLAIARAIVQAHGGQIEVHSALGGGSAFSVKLPVADAPGGETAE